jgi:hypothetical protein
VLLLLLLLLLVGQLPHRTDKMVGHLPAQSVPLKLGQQQGLPALQQRQKLKLLQQRQKLKLLLLGAAGGCPGPSTHQQLMPSRRPGRTFCHQARQT